MRGSRGNIATTDGSISGPYDAGADSCGLPARGWPRRSATGTGRPCKLLTPSFTKYLVRERATASIHRSDSNESADVNAPCETSRAASCQSRVQAHRELTLPSDSVIIRQIEQTTTVQPSHANPRRSLASNADVFGARQRDAGEDESDAAHLLAQLPLPLLQLPRVHRPPPPPPPAPLGVRGRTCIGTRSCARALPCSRRGLPGHPRQHSRVVVQSQSLHLGLRGRESDPRVGICAVRNVCCSNNHEKRFARHSD